MTSDQLQNQSPEPSVTDSAEEVSPPYLAFVGINEAARLTGKGKQQIYRDIKAGKLSWQIEDGGKKLLQIADLDRVYKLKNQAVTGNETSSQNRVLPQYQDDVTTQKAIDTAVELAVLKERVSRLEDENSDLKQTRDRLLEQNERLTMLLPAPPTSSEQPPEPIKRQSFWKRLFS